MIRSVIASRIYSRQVTSQKLIKRTIWRDHTNLLVDRQNALIEELRVLATDGFTKAKEEWEKSVSQWGAHTRSSPCPSKHP